MRDLLNDLEAGKYLSDADPMKRARNQMRTALPKRFYETVTTAEEEGGHVVHLDGRPVRTPAGAVLVLPTAAAARLVADEYAAQEDHIVPLTMPVTRLANTAFDGVSSAADAVLEDILKYSTSDLLCYRADSPEALVERQSEAWDPVLDWARSELGARFALAEGVMHVEQPRETIGAVAVHLRKRAEPFRLAAMHLMTSLTGSALLALAVEAHAIEAETAWAAAHIDEDWNVEHWGEDSEAAKRRAGRKRDMMAAVALLDALGS
ncbi:MAG: ATPase [Rhizobiales bacterium 65-79]|jgi:chaperone required for assembly of F1-ATPase|nr:ATPase [Hyphomicrobiales bacterium]OJU03516.1 MAG: ATPase [Rhizobiales bacterium 65-79]